MGSRWRKESTADGFLNNKIFLFKYLEDEFFDEGLKRAEDFDLFFRIMPKLKNGILVPDAWYFYRKRKSSLTSTIKETGDMQVFLKNRYLLDRRSKYEQTAMQHKFIRSVYTSCCAAVKIGDYERFHQLIGIYKQNNLKYKLMFDDYRMVLLLALPFSLFKLHSMYRNLINSDTANYFE